MYKTNIVAKISDPKFGSINKKKHIGTKNVIDGNLGFFHNTYTNCILVINVATVWNFITKFGITNFSYQFWFYTWLMNIYHLLNLYNRDWQWIIPHGTTQQFGEITRISQETLFMHFVLLNHHVCFL